MKTVAELIDDLFRTHRKENGREYTYKEVCDTVGNLQSSHLSRLRHGQISNPGREVLLALCQFFKVSPTYFFPELADLELVENSDKKSSRDITLVIQGDTLNAEAQAKIDELIAILQRGEHIRP